MRNKNARVSDPHSFASSVGDRVHKLFQSRFDGSRVVLEESGSFDIQDRINGYAPYTDISYMLNRLTVGDNSVLAARPPMYGDFSGMPDNPIDAINLYHGAEQAFSLLSAEDRLSYNNDFRLWLSAVMGGAIARPGDHVDSKPAVDIQPNSAGSEPVEKE